MKVPRLNVLVVEDDASMRSLLQLHLANAGYVVSVAEDAISAGHRILKYAPDLLILDVELPYINGIEFAATLQADSTLPYIPIIFITAHEDFAERAALLGQDFILKPFRKERLLESVARNIGRATDIAVAKMGDRLARTTTMEIRVLQRAAEILGSEQALAARLRVSIVDLFLWLCGSRRPASASLMEAMEILAERGDAAGLAQLHSMAPLIRDGIGLPNGFVVRQAAT